MGDSISDFRLLLWVILFLTDSHILIVSLTKIYILQIILV